MSLTTRGGLTPAKLTNSADSTTEVAFMFNPNEYTLTKTNTWKSKWVDLNVPAQEFTEGGPQTLKLVLYFDTAEEAKDVRDLSKPLWTMAMLHEPKKNTHSEKTTPPAVE